MKPELNKDKKEQVNFYAKYTSLAFQMVVIIGLGTFGGYKLDHVLGLKFNVFTILFSLVSVALAIYFAIKDFIHPSKK